MSEYSDRMESMTVKVVSPDKNIMAVLSNKTTVELTFRGRAYSRYTDTSLSEQLTGMARLIFAGRKRARIAILSDINGFPLKDDDRTNLDRRERELRTQRAEVVAKGTSSGDCVRVSSRGMRDWKVKVRPGTMDKLSEDQFKAEARTAVAAFLRDYRLKMARIREQVYGLSKETSRRPVEVRR